MVELKTGLRLNQSIVIQAVCGWSHCLIITNGYHLFAWGDNSLGQLGTGDLISR